MSCSRRPSAFIFSGTLITVLILMSQPGATQGWLGRVLDSAAQAAEKMDQTQDSETPSEPVRNSAVNTGSDPSTRDPEIPQPGSQAPSEETATQLTSDPAISSTSPGEPDTGWAILHDMLSNPMPEVGKGGPLLAVTHSGKLESQVAKAAQESIVDEPAVATPTPRTTPRSSATSSQNRNNRNASSNQRSRNTSNRSSNSGNQRQQQSAPPERRPIYNPYSVYSR
jgi:hypothetical protein